MSAHTPGPWKVDSPPRTVTFEPAFAVNGDYGPPLAFVLGSDDHPEVRANARLIAAAPDLLEALEAALPWIDLARGSDLNTDASHEAIDRIEAQARAAIAKAKGEEA